MKSLYLVPLSILIWFGSLNGVSAETLLDKIQKQYQSVSSFQGRFQQINYSETDEKQRVGTGEVHYLKPGKMRWYYESPEEQLMVTNGKTLWLYDPLLENVTIQALDQATRGTPLDFLLGIGSLTDDFEQRELTRTDLLDNSLEVVELVPLNPIGTIRFIQFGANPQSFELKEILLFHARGTYSRIILKDLSYDITLDPKLFEFEVKESMEVIRADQDF